MGCGNNGKLPHLFIPSKTATLVPENAVGDLPLGRTATLMSALGQNTLMASSSFVRYYELNRCFEKGRYFKYPTFEKTQKKINSNYCT